MFRVMVRGCWSRKRIFAGMWIPWCWGAHLAWLHGGWVRSGRDREHHSSCGHQPYWCLGGPLAAFFEITEGVDYGMMGAAGGLLIAGMVMNTWLPIDKSMWTSACAVFMAGVSTFCMAAFYCVMDAKGYRRWAISFEIFGMNALAIYMLSMAIARLLYLVGWPQVDGSFLDLCGYPFRILFQPWAAEESSSFI
jgi:hypothetical protein